MEKTIEIPEGYEARVEGNKVILEPKESEDERIRKELIQYHTDGMKDSPWFTQTLRHKDVLAYLERQKAIVMHTPRYAPPEQKEQQPVQDEEEREYVRTLKSLIADFLRDKDEIDREYYQDIYDWLDGRHIEQKLAEWSEEDVEKLANIGASKSGVLTSEMTFYRQGVRDAFNYKGFRPSWKPSEEQMEALRRAAYSLVGTGTETDVYLVQLYEQLEKL